MDNTFLQETMFSIETYMTNHWSCLAPPFAHWWNGQDRKKKDDLIDHMVNLFDNTFNKKVVTKLADKNLKYTRAQYRDKLQIDLKNERPPMVP
jgi:GTP-dependent phosphoenolpyruvate carboxykinase